MRLLIYCWIMVLLASAPCSSLGAELPVWEAGLGLSALTFPDYRGSDQNHLYVFPIPFFVYRGDVLRVNRNTVRGVFLETNTFVLDASFSGSPPVRSGQNGARRGMPGLDPSLEAGPSLKYLLSDPHGPWKAELQFPLRAVLVTDLSYLRYSGLVFNPRFNVDWNSGDIIRRWSAGVGLGPVFIDSRNSRHYYGVDPLYATSERPAYAAHGGYAGMQLVVSSTYRARNIWVGAFIRGDSIDHAVFEDSPLVKARWNIAAAVAVSWVFGTAEKLVESDE